MIEMYDVRHDVKCNSFQIPLKMKSAVISLHIRAQFNLFVPAFLDPLFVVSVDFDGSIFLERCGMWANFQ